MIFYKSVRKKLTVFLKRVKEYLIKTELYMSIKTLKSPQNNSPLKKSKLLEKQFINFLVFNNKFICLEHE